DIEGDLTDPGHSYKIHVSHAVDETGFDEEFLSALNDSGADMVVDLSDQPAYRPIRAPGGDYGRWGGRGREICPRRRTGPPVRY
ncbi:MAG TPA: hypothetical protein VKA68_06685, partial [bacterium]|nr:hypothetical protein [bacterium]